MKKRLVLLSCILTVSLLAGCSEKNTDDTTSTTTEQTTQTTQTTQIEENDEGTDTENEAKTADVSDVDISDDLFSYEFNLNGDNIKLPMSYEDFTALGWTTKADTTEELKQYQYSLSEVFEKDGIKIYACFINNTQETLPESKCDIGGIDIDSFYLKDVDFSFTLPNGIAYGVSTIDDIKNAYGEPDRVHEGALYTELTYKSDNYNDIKIRVNLESGVITDIEIRNL